MSKHRYHYTPATFGIMVLGKIILALLSLQAKLIRLGGKK